MFTKFSLKPSYTQDGEQSTIELCRRKAEDSGCGPSQHKRVVSATVVYEGDPKTEKSRKMDNSIQREVDNIMKVKCVDLSSFLEEQNIDYRDPTLLLELLTSIYELDLRDTSTTLQFPISVIMISMFLLCPKWGNVLCNTIFMKKWEVMATQGLFPQYTNAYDKLMRTWQIVNVNFEELDLWKAWTMWTKLLRNEHLDTLFIPCVREFETQPTGVSPMLLHHRDLSIVLTSLERLINSPLSPDMIVSFNWLQFMTSTSTMCTHVPGLKPVLHGENGNDPDFEEEFRRLTSNLATGAAAGSLDITLAIADSPYTLQSEVKMEELVYELNIYKKSDIQNHPKDQWYTVPDAKLIGTTQLNTETHKLLNSLKKIQLEQLKQQPNLRTVKQFCWTDRGK